ncbi:cell division cycle protein 27 homolog [Drosophila tropicalis]|uniref:cell division cycle protein 27 homolog n=1 Tax=Drosophila tropicalis TaxID=46794 RepID=UPI0035ABDD8B
MMIQEPVQAAIWHCLNHYDLKDAIFLAERLCSEVESDETIFLLATSYFRSNLIHQAYWLLKEKSRRSPQCRFLQAKCAFELKNYADAESILITTGYVDTKHFDDLQKEFGELACFVYQLLAQICMQTERHKLAVQALRRTLKLNPFMWSAFTDLCLLGQDADVGSIFQIQSTDVFNTCQGSSANANAMVIFGSNGVNGGSIGLGGGGGASCDKEQLTNYLLNTPIDQQQPIQTPPNHLNNNNINLNSSIGMLRGGTGSGGVGTGLLEDTPMSGYNQEYDVTPFRKQIKYLSTFSPSFGIMPLTSPCAGGDNSYSSYHGSPLPQIFSEVNQDAKIMGKKLKTIGVVGGGVGGGIINRKDVKPNVFTQAGNITPRTPISNNSINNNVSQANGNPITGNPNNAVRRSSRLFSNSTYSSVKENNKSTNFTNNKFVQPRSPPRKTKNRIPKICLNNELKEKVETITTSSITASNNNNNNNNNNNARNPTEEAKVLLNNSLNNAQTMAHQLLNLKKQSADGLMSLLRDLADGYKLLSNYRCKASIKHLETTIPKHHLSSSWVQSLIGLAFYEQRDYESAISIFRQIHEMDPHRLDYMEIYSTSLWHLQREVELSALAQDLINQDKRNPITWCVSGNCFSLHKEHETAIKFLKRAVQIDPDFVYSYTLLGHELVLTEEFDKAMDYFRSAVVRDPRHYNAWCGIGTIYSKQEKYELAELHYIKALKINPQNSVILVHIGAMQFFMQKKDLALQTLNTAATIDPKNPLARFHRGSIYFSLGKYQEALRELEELKEIVPKESVVFYLIGKIHKTLGNMDLALMHFSWATDLDPKGANNQIKDAFDSMAHPSCCPATSSANDTNTLDVDFEPTSERSDDSTQAQQDVSYDSDY